MSAPNLVFELIPEAQLLVSCQTTLAPSDAEWDEYLVALAQLQVLVPRPRSLVLTNGGVPSHSQRLRLRVDKSRPPAPVAVLSSSSAVRFVLSVLALVNPAMRSFNPHELDAAMSYLGIPSQQTALVYSVIARLRQALVARAA
jgi:hypothetical protein